MHWFTVGILPLFVILASALPLGAAEDLSRDIRFDRLGIDDGLSSSSVSSIIQDREGFVWFGTQSGLNRYDGYSIERFEHDPFDRNSLSHNLIQTMFYDRSGVFWIGTYGGLNRFDPNTGEFRHYQDDPENPHSLSNNVVVTIERDATGALWVGTLEGLNRLEDDRFVVYTPDTDGSGALPDKVVRDVQLDHRGDLWVGTYGGLSRYDPGTDSFDTITTTGEPGHVLPSPYVMKILPDPQDEDVLWVGTWEGGVSRFDTRTGRIETFSLPQNEIYTMLFDSEGRLWVGTWNGGLYVVDPDTADFTAIVSGEDRTASGLSHDVIYSLMEDESGIVWIGTNGGGVNAYVPWENRFDSLVHDPKDTDSIGAGKVVAAHVDSDGTAWFGTYNHGLSRRDPESGAVHRYEHDSGDPWSLSHDLVNDIFRDSRGDLWVGTNRGLNRYVPERDGFDRFYAGDGAGALPDDVIGRIAESPSGELWIGTYTSGVALFDPERGVYRIYRHDPSDPQSLTDNLIRSIVHDSRGNVWVATNRGLNRLAPETGRVVRYLHDVDDEGSISSNNVRDVYEDSAGRLWIATTGGGVNLYDYETDSFSFLSTRDGLASHHVLAVTEDERGTLWFPTNRGISVYDPETTTFRTLNASDGLLSNELTEAMAKGPDGKLFFGGVSGVTVIDAVVEAYSEYSPPLVVTSFDVLGVQRKLSPTGDGTYEQVVLDYADSYFSFEFAALDYSSPLENNYAYMLEGFDAEWNVVGNRRYASYTNIRPGTYTLRIRGSGSRGNWNEQGVAIPILVRPPWWRGDAALAAYVVLIAIIALGVWRRIARGRALSQARLVEQERINQELERKVRERTAEIEHSRTLAERATKAKSLFLANMSHEIRTPLNGMMGMLSLLEKTSLEEQQREYLKFSRASAENLNTLVNDLLDFERIEAGKLRLTNERFSIEESVGYIEQLFQPTAESKGLSLEVELDLDGASHMVRGDRSRFVQVLTNLVSNAMKYTHEGGVRVRVAAIPERPVQRYEIRVEDTGIGIDPGLQSVVFERFRQLDNGYSKSARGVGLGLSIVKQVLDAMGGSITVASTQGEGSVFQAVVPLEPADESTGAQDEPGAQADAGAASADASEPRRILVCEDEAINRLYLSHHLNALGYVVDVAADGLEAVEKATSDDYDLVFMDLGMPHVSGLDATRRIRDWERENARDSVPIIALTAHTYGGDVEKCYDAGMTGFVSKPIREAELKRVVSQWLGT